MTRRGEDGWRPVSTIEVTTGGAFVFEDPAGRAIVVLIATTATVEDFAVRTLDRALDDGWRLGQLTARVLADGAGVAFSGVPPSTLVRYAMEVLASFE